MCSIHRVVDFMALLNGWKNVIIVATDILYLKLIQCVYIKYDDTETLRSITTQGFSVREPVSLQDRE